MILKVEVDLSDIYSEEEGNNLSSEILDNIEYNVKRKVYDVFEKEQEAEFSKRIVAEIEKERETLIGKQIDDLFKSARVKRYGSSGDLISISEYVKAEFERFYMDERGLKNKLDAQTKQFAAEMSSKLQDRYDLLFASQIVSKLNDNGMLKEDVAKMLLD